MDENLDGSDVRLPLVEWVVENIADAWHTADMAALTIFQRALAHLSLDSSFQPRLVRVEQDADTPV